MVSELFDYLLSLLINSVKIFCVVRRHLAAKHKVLPYEYTLFIAKVEERGVLVDTSAPYTHHVAVKIVSKVKSPFHLCVSFTVKGIERLPVGSVNIYPLPVADENKLSVIILVNTVGIFKL